MEKICCTCKTLKPITEFYTNRNGRLTTCKPCAAIKYSHSNNEIGLADKIYTELPAHPGSSYAEHVAFKIARREMSYAEARYTLKYSSRGQKTWFQVVMILKNWK